MPIIGSVALKHWFPDLKRIPRDVDLICKPPFPPRSSRIEFHWVDAFQYILDNKGYDSHVPPDFLYTIKVSHAAWDIWWDKTMHDIMFMQSHGCKLDQELYRLLIPEWEKKHGVKRIVVSGPAEEFFTKSITRRIPHEDIHALVKFNDRPMHELIRPDLSDVRCSKELWDKLTYRQRLQCAWEETYVFALERYYSSHKPPKASVLSALKHLITRSTKGWFNLFLIENFKTLLYEDRDNFARIHTKYKEIVSHV